ncbi:MAG: hypothetical protein HYX79_00570 [Chloroflexi bacterium]|nr:hypothetical protein [Chloroflexota bacterium]
MRDQETLPNKMPVSEEDIDKFLQELPQLVERFKDGVEILTGKKAQTPLLNSDVKQKIRIMAPMANQLEDLQHQPLTPAKAKKLIVIINRLLRLINPSIPRNVEPISYLAKAMKQLAEVPQGLILPQGLDYKNKHVELYGFICDLTDSIESSQLDTFLNSALSEQHLVSPIQRALSGLVLPKEFRKPLKRVSIRTAEKAKSALREVTTDWEVLINLIYGLLLLEQGQKTHWDSIRGTSLQNKVTALSKDPRINTLVKQEWVILRNSLSHGTAFFKPSDRCIEFRDRKRSIIRSVDTTYTEGANIYLANCAMLQTYNFVHIARFRNFESQIVSLKKLASQHRS